MRLCKALIAIVLAMAIASASYLAGFGTSMLLFPTPPPVTPTERAQQFAVFWEAWGIVEQEFYRREQLDREEMVYGAIRGALESLNDPYTAFVDPAHAAILSDDMKGSFDGIGAVVTMEDGRLLIVEPLKGQPAERAGLRRGDVILKVDDTEIKDMSLIEAIALIRGPRGTAVSLTIQREGMDEPFVVELVRERIAIPVIEADLLDERIAYVKLHGLNGQASQSFKAVLKELLAQKPVGLILDLRSNPGGFLHIAVEVSSQLIDKGLILVERGKGEAERRHWALKGGLATDIPLVVLINGATASGAEIVAGAIQDHGRGVLIGERTFGKGFVQNIHDLSDGSNLRVTVSRWLTPEGRWVEGQGLIPDIEIKLTAEDFEDRDPQLERAIEYLLKGR